MNVFSIYKDKKVLITGHTGFKGSWLSLWLENLGAKVFGISDAIPTKPSNFEVSDLGKHVVDNRADVADFSQIKNIIQEIKPDFIFNLAAQALVRKSYSSPRETIMTNSIGTTNILEAVNQIDRSVICVMITSDKVYRNYELQRGYTEEDELGGSDPYSASKAMAELALRSYIGSFFKNREHKIKIGIARAGNVIGGGDWAEDRIVPDCIRSWSKNETLSIRNPLSTRPWQHVLEPLSGYLLLGANLFKSKIDNGAVFNFGPKKGINLNVGELISLMSKRWPHSKWTHDVTDESMIKESNLLELNCEKANKLLKWYPALESSEMANMTLDWYMTYSKDKASMYDYSSKQISEYINIAKNRKINWAIKDDF